MAGQRARSVRPVTMGPYRAAVNHASRAFGAPAIGEITRTDIERLAASLTDAGPRARTCSLTLFVLRSIFGPALDDGLIVRNPAAKGAGEWHRAEAMSGVQRGRPRHAARARRGRSARRGVVVDVARSPQERNPRAHVGGCGLERRYGHGLTLDHSGRVRTSRRTDRHKDPQRRPLPSVGR